MIARFIGFVLLFSALLIFMLTIRLIYELLDEIQIWNSSIESNCTASNPFIFNDYYCDFDTKQCNHYKLYCLFKDTQSNQTMNLITYQSNILNQIIIKQNELCDNSVYKCIVNKKLNLIHVGKYHIDFDLPIFIMVIIALIGAINPILAEFANEITHINYLIHNWYKESLFESLFDSLNESLQILDQQIDQRDELFAHFFAQFFAFPIRVFEQVIEYFANILIGDKLLCCICMTNKRNIIFISCSHVCSCEGCAQKITICPMCRVLISERKKAIIS